MPHHFLQLAVDKDNNIYASKEGYIFEISPIGSVSVFSDLTSYSKYNEYYSSVFAIQGMAISKME